MIAIGCDHGGYSLKVKLMDYYRDIEFKDFGTFSEDLVDFPDIAFSLAESVSNGDCESGILICRSGIGMSIAANKVKGIRCALCYSKSTAKSAKEHSNANIITIGADEKSFEETIEIIDAWLNCKFIGGRYKTRLDKIDKYEESMR